MFNRDGGSNPQILDPRQQNVQWCANLYVNGGFTEDTSPRLIALADPPPITVGRMATSWATPLALTHAIYLKNMGIAETPGALQSYFRTRSGTPKMIDRLKFDQFELYAR